MKQLQAVAVAVVLVAASAAAYGQCTNEGTATLSVSGAPGSAIASTAYSLSSSAAPTHTTVSRSSIGYGNAIDFEFSDPHGCTLSVAHLEFRAGADAKF